MASRCVKVVGRNVDRLHGSDRTVFGRGDALLHLTHLGGQRRLIAHGRRHAAQQGRDLRTGLRETEDVVDEEEDILRLSLAAAIAERLGNGQSRQGHRKTCPRRFVHLAEHERGLRTGDLVVIDLRKVPVPLVHALAEGVAIADHTRGDHLAQQIVALARSFTDTGKDREAVVFLGDVVDQLHDEHRLAHTGAAEQTDLAALDIRLQQVDYLDARREHLLRGGQFVELRRLAVNRSLVCAVKRPHAVDPLARNIKQATLDLVADGHRDRTPAGRHLHVTLQSVGRIHRDGPHGILADVLLHLDNEFRAVVPLDRHRFVNARQKTLFAQIGEVYVDHRSDDLRNVSFNLCHITNSL